MIARNDGTRSEGRGTGRLLRRVSALLAVLCVFLAPLGAQSAIQIYHSPNDDGQQGASDLGGGQQTLHLYVDGGPFRSNFDECGPEGNGDEVCAYLADIEAVGDVEFSSFVGQPGVQWRADSFTLSFAGGEPLAGHLGPTKIGDLNIDANGEGSVDLVWGQAVSANQQLVQLSSELLVTVPEPTTGLGLAIGTVALILISRRKTQAISAPAGY